MINTPPITGPIVDRDGMVTMTIASWLHFMWLAANSVTESGTTAQRPTANLWVGRPFMDTTLGKPIWVNAVTPSVVWVDATGASV